MRSSSTGHNFLQVKIWRYSLFLFWCDFEFRRDFVTNSNTEAQKSAFIYTTGDFFFNFMFEFSSVKIFLFLIVSWFHMFLVFFECHNFHKPSSNCWNESFTVGKQSKKQRSSYIFPSQHIVGRILPVLFVGPLEALPPFIIQKTWILFLRLPNVSNYWSLLLPVSEIFHFTCNFFTSHNVYFSIFFATSGNKHLPLLSLAYSFEIFTTLSLLWGKHFF